MQNGANKTRGHGCPRTTLESALNPRQILKFGDCDFSGAWNLDIGAFHLPDSATRYLVTNSSFSSMPSPGPSGAVIQPSMACSFSCVSSWRIGESSTQSSKMNASRQVASQCRLAATVIGLV